jgi:uncharacterized protein (DUF1778 family)
MSHVVHTLCVSVDLTPSAMRRTRSERLHFRATQEQSQLIRLAAKETHSSISNFVLESACLRSEQTLASKQHFELDPAAWAEFMAALDKPIQQKPHLRKLLSEPSILERR